MERKKSLLNIEASAREREVLEAALRAKHGNLGEVAEQLGTGRRTIERRVKDFGLGELAAELRRVAGIPGPRGAVDKCKVCHRRLGKEAGECRDPGGRGCTSFARKAGGL